MAKTSMVPTRTTADALIGKIIVGALLIYLGSNALTLFARAIGLFTLML